MKNKILSIITIFLLLLMPIKIFASTKEYETKNLIETLKEEKIELTYEKYKETDEQIIIYMFRGRECTYCKAFLTFLNGITEEYGKYFKLESYEVWYDQKNSDLMIEISEFLEQPATGVPYVIIGDKVFAGYADVYDEQIKTAIKELYDSKDRYDVFEEMKKAETISNIKNIINICTLPISIIGIISVLIITDKKYKKLNQRITQLEETYITKNDNENNKKATKETIEKETAKENNEKKKSKK